jgi:hypothetical protein
MKNLARVFDWPFPKIEKAGSSKPSENGGRIPGEPVLY